MIGKFSEKSECIESMQPNGRESAFQEVIVPPSPETIVRMMFFSDETILGTILRQTFINIL